MTETFEQQIAESLHNRASSASLNGAGFGDVRRRARRRRQRHVAAAVVPAMLGTAWLGMRPAPGGTSALPVGAGAPTDTAAITPPVDTGPSDDGAVATVPDSVYSSDPVMAPASTTPALSSDQIGRFVCLDASGGSPDSLRECQGRLGGGMSFTAGSLTDHSFVMALDPAYQIDAEEAAGLFGLPIEPLQAPVLTGIDLAGTDARVIVVIGQFNPPCTVPGCADTTTSLP